MSRRAPTLIAAFGSVAAMLGFWGADWVNAIRARSAPVAALAEPPNVAWASIVIAAALLAGGLALAGVLRGRGTDFRGYRVAPILLVCALFVELFVFGEQRVPFSSSDRMKVTLQLFAQLASEQGKDGHIPDDSAQLSTLASQLGHPPYLAHGQPASGYQVQLRQGCDGPVKEAPGSSLGTLLYCVSPDRTRAWVSVVALPAERRFGDPALFTEGGIVQWAQVSAPQGSASAR